MNEKKKQKKKHERVDDPTEIVLCGGVDGRERRPLRPRRGQVSGLITREYVTQTTVYAVGIVERGSDDDGVEIDVDAVAESLVVFRLGRDQLRDVRPAGAQGAHPLAPHPPHPHTTGLRRRAFTRL